MNYRHAFHAGNVADVLKHAVLALVTEHLKLKPGPFAVLDTHAGIGLYDLTSEAAKKTGEWRAGIGRLLGPDAVPIPAEVQPILAGYLDVVRAENPVGALQRYPGSPLIARNLLRNCDRLMLCELHPADAGLLATLFGRDKQVSIEPSDGWMALKARLPPRERRGLILIDPPFEEKGEFERIVQGLEAGLRRFATGCFLIWYPIKDAKPIARFHTELASLATRGTLKAELLQRRPTRPDQLNGAGLIVINPPFTLYPKLASLLPWLAATYGEAGAGFSHLHWLRQPDGSGS